MWFGICLVVLSERQNMSCLDFSIYLDSILGAISIFLYFWAKDRQVIFEIISDGSLFSEVGKCKHSPVVWRSKQQ